MGRAALKSVGENPKPTGTFRPGAEGTEMNRFQSWVYSFGCRRWGQQLAISLEVVERLLTSDVHRFPTFTSHFCIILHHSASFCIILHHSASLSFSHMHPETLSCHVQGIPDTEWWKDPAALVPAPLLETATPGPCFGPLRSIAMGTVHTLSPVAIASFASFSSFDSGSFGSLMKDCTTEMFETRYCESM